MSDGTSILVARDSVDLVFSNQLIEHLHPDDVPLHLANVIKSLVKGGRYYCITPSRLTGPHDISMYFDDVATGLHLKEYTYSDLSALMRSAGFTKVSAVVNFKNHIIMQPPLSLMKLLERAYVLLPLALRRSLRPSRAVAVIFGVEIIATK